MSMRGARARIGFLWPADGLNDDEYWSYLPDCVAWLTARYTPATGDETLTLDTIDAYADPALIARAARLLEAVKPHAVACGDNAASVVRGRDGDRAMAAAVEAVLHVPVATAGGAILAGLAAFQAGTIGLVSPYPADLTERLSAFLEAAGHGIAKLITAGETDEWGIGGATPDRWARAARAAGSAPVDAVVVAGGGIRMSGAIEPLERDLARPVIATPAALVWHAARLAGIDVRAAGEGRLYREHGRPPATGDGP